MLTPVFGRVHGSTVIHAPDQLVTAPSGIDPDCGRRG